MELHSASVFRCHVRTRLFHLLGEENRGLYPALAHTGRTSLLHLHLNRRTNPLTGNLHQTELTERQHVMLGAVAFHQFPYIVVQLLLVVLGIHIDEIDDDDSSDVPQPQLVYQLIRCQHVELVGVLLLVLVNLLAAGIDINGEQCFGLVDDEIPTMLETDRSAEPRLHLTSDVEMVENRLRALIKFDNLGALGSDKFQIMTDFVVDVLVIDLDGREIRAEHIADDAKRAAHLLADEAHGFALLQALDRLVPALQQQAQLIVEFGCTFVLRYRTNDNPEALRLDREHQLSETLAFRLAFNLLGYHHAIGKRNKDNVATCDRYFGCQTGTFGVDRLFGYLNQNRVAHLQHVGYLSFFAYLRLPLDLRHGRYTTPVGDGFGNIRMQRTILRT